MLPEAQTDKLAAYVRYARTELVYKRALASAAENPDMEPYAQRAKEALDMEWRAYRTASKALERAGG